MIYLLLDESVLTLLLTKTRFKELYSERYYYQLVLKKT